MCVCVCLCVGDLPENISWLDSKITNVVSSYRKHYVRLITFYYLSKFMRKNIKLNELQKH